MTMRPLGPALTTHPVPARPEPASAPVQVRAEPAPLPEDPLRTSWGFGPRENQFNAQIAKAVEGWGVESHPLPGRLFKALVGVESEFDPTAVSRSGAAGLVQLMPGTAKAHGLSLSPVDERLVPAKALPVGVAVLREKHDVITRPGQYVEAGIASPWGEKVAQAYQELGPPTGDDLWRLDLAAYNGGGGTVLRAMATAYDRKLDPRKWENLLGTPDKVRESPLYLAVKDVFGDAAALRKYHEMARYPGKILALRDRA